VRRELARFERESFEPESFEAPCFDPTCSHPARDQLPAALRKRPLQKAALQLRLAEQQPASDENHRVHRGFGDAARYEDARPELTLT
jgi:hypothetical protein